MKFLGKKKDGAIAVPSEPNDQQEGESFSTAPLSPTKSTSSSSPSTKRMRKKLSSTLLRRSPKNKKSSDGKFPVADDNTGKDTDTDAASAAVVVLGGGDEEEGKQTRTSNVKDEQDEEKADDTTRFTVSPDIDVIQPLALEDDNSANNATIDAQVVISDTTIVDEKKDRTMSKDATAPEEDDGGGKESPGASNEDIGQNADNSIVAEPMVADAAKAEVSNEEKEKVDEERDDSIAKVVASSQTKGNDDESEISANTSAEKKAAPTTGITTEVQAIEKAPSSDEEEITANQEENEEEHTSTATGSAADKDTSMALDELSVLVKSFDEQLESEDAENKNKSRTSASDEVAEMVNDEETTAKEDLGGGDNMTLATNASSTLSKVFEEIEKEEHRRPGGVLSTPSHLCRTTSASSNKVGSLVAAKIPTPRRSPRASVPKLKSVQDANNEDDEEEFRVHHDVVLMLPSQTAIISGPYRRAPHVNFFWRTNPVLSFAIQS